MERQQSFYEKAEALQDTNPEVLLRIEGNGEHSIDVIAAKVHYHDVCMKRFMVISESPRPLNIYHESFCDLVKEIDNDKQWISIFLLQL